MNSSNGNRGVSKIGTILTVIFVVSLAALLAELFYVLWRRRIFYRSQTSAADQLSDNSCSESATFSPIASSKELLYFLCIRPQARMEGNSANESSIVSNDVNQELDMEVIDLMKINGMFGPPRFLFTIKEEEKEDMDSPVKKSVDVSSADRVEHVKKNKSGVKVSLEDCLIKETKEEENEDEESMVVVEIVDNVATPFSTPCASPLYFTPSNSPIHENVVTMVNEWSTPGS